MKLFKQNYKWTHLGYLMLVFAALLLHSCSANLSGCMDGEGEVAMRNVELGQDINGVELGFTSEVIIKESELQSIRIEGYSNIVDAILSESNVDDGIWKLNVEGCSTTGGTKIFINVPSIEYLSLNDAGFIKTDGRFNAIEELNIRLNDAGHIDLDLGAAKKISIQSNDAGVVKVSGKTDELEIQSNDTGDVNAGDLESKICNFQSNDDGELLVYVTEVLSGEINDSGVVCYKGDPQIIVKIEDAGELRDCN